MRGVLLSELRLALRAQIGQTMDTGAATADDSRLNYLLMNKQRWLDATYDWSFLVHKWDVAVPVGSRYLNFPATDIEGNAAVVNIERPLMPEVLFNRVYNPIDYGIGGAEFTYLNSDLLQAADPIRRWQLVDTVSNATGTTFRFEIWPLNVSTQAIRFTGQRALRPLIADTDRCDLDDQLLLYMVAAEELADTARGKIMAGLAAARLNSITSIYPHKENRVVLGRPSRDSRLFRNPNRKLIGIAAAQSISGYVPDP